VEDAEIVNMARRGVARARAWPRGVEASCAQTVSRQY
jgi:hypothetical protein